MIPRSTASTKNTLLPAGTGAFVKRRATEIAGIALTVLAVLTAIALLAFDPSDPSWNRAADGPVANLLGQPGAYAADVILQTLGLSGTLIVLLLLAWSWRLLSHRGLPLLWLNVTFAPLTLLLAAGAMSSIAAPASWPLRSGLGGWLGDYLFGLAIAAGQALGIGPWALGLSLGVLALAAFVFAVGLSRDEWRSVGAALLWSGVRITALLRRVPDLRRLADRVGPRKSRTAPPSPGRTRRKPRATRSEEKDNGLRAATPMASTSRRTAESWGESGAESRVEKPAAKVKAGRREQDERQPALNLKGPDEYQLPPLNLLHLPRSAGREKSVDEHALEQNARLLESVLDDFGVRGDIVKVRPGPVVTLYELEPAPGTKSARVINLSDDIARSMSAISARVAVIPGRNAIGIELPNTDRHTVFLRELLSTAEYESTASLLTLALGKDIGGAPVMADLARMPHLLIAGTTGSGKSVAINTMILSLLYRLPPDQCRFIMIDPKMLELSVYDGIPHLLAPVVTEPGKAIVALKWTVREMEDRYRKMSELGVRNLAGYNKRLAEARDKDESLNRTVQTGFDAATGEPVYEEKPLDLEPLPLIVVIVDEMADLMMVAGKDVEAAIQRLAQMARAAGIHLIMATQRPSVDVITGTIKANFPTRISFQVTSKIDSRTILGEQGAEQLLGAGDMLYMAGAGRITRVHGPFVSDDEVEKVVKALKRQGMPDYNDEITAEPEEGFADVPGLGGSEGGDALYDQAVAIVCGERKASTSFIQRRLQIGYNRAARLIERMEAEGVISAANHVGKREVLARDIEDRAS